MKKLISILLCVVTILAFAVAGCGEVAESVEKVVQSESVEFTVSVDKNIIKGKRDLVTVTVTAVALKDLEVTVSTSSYDKPGAIELQCYTEIDGEEYILYDDLYGTGQNQELYEFTMLKGESVTRTFKLSRVPPHPEYLLHPETRETMPKGDYKVKVYFVADKPYWSSWVETDITITAK